MQINKLLRQVHQHATLGNNKANHRIDEKLNQLIYKDSIQVGDIGSTTHHSYLGCVTKRNDIVLQVRNENGENDWAYCIHVHHLVLQLNT